MPRPHLPVAPGGEINVTSETKTAKEGKTRTTFRAFAYYRDYDGITRQVERAGKSRTDASNRLKEAVRDRAKRFNDSEITGDSLVSDLGKLWLRRIAERVAAEKLAPTTGQSFEDQYNRTVLPAVGNLKIRECTARSLGSTR